MAGRRQIPREAAVRPGWSAFMSLSTGRLHAYGRKTRRRIASTLRKLGAVYPTNDHRDASGPLEGHFRKPSLVALRPRSPSKLARPGSLEAAGSRLSVLRTGGRGRSPRLPTRSGASIARGSERRSVVRSVSGQSRPPRVPHHGREPVAGEQGRGLAIADSTTAPRQGGRLGLQTGRRRNASGSHRSPAAASLASFRSLEDFARQIQTGAFRPTGDDLARRTAEATAAAVAILEQINRKVGGGKLVAVAGGPE